MVLVQLMRLGGRRDLLSPCAKRKNSFALEISQVDLSGTDRRVQREDLAPVDVLMTASAVAKAGFVDCGECVKLGIDVLKAPSEVGGDPPSEVMECSPLERMRGVL